MIIPVRDLARGGVVKDVQPPALGAPVFSDGRNVIFENGKVSRAPVWRSVATGLGPNARYAAAVTPTSGIDQMLVANDDASVSLYSNGVITVASEPGFTPRPAITSPWTSCLLGDVLYLNRPDGIPRVLRPDAAYVTPLTNWPATWRANAIRQFQDTVLALGVTQGPAALPAQINISDIAYFGQVPDSWDTTDPTKLAYSNDLAQLDGPILDGMTLNGNFLFYTSTQTWQMIPGGAFNYSFRKLFSNCGILNTNCVIEVGGLHYVFGSRDIFVTDGNTFKSIAEGRVRQWLYRTLDLKKTWRCFVTFLPQTNCVRFAYVTGDSSAAWQSPTGCNAALDYHIPTDTWAPADLPNVSAMVNMNLVTQPTWANIVGSWTTAGGAWFDQTTTFVKHSLGVNAPLATTGSVSNLAGGSILGYDFVDHGQLAAPIDITCLAPSFAAHTGIALDQPQQGQAPLNQSKVVRAIYPEVAISRPATMQITTGASMTLGSNIAWNPPVPFDPVAEYQYNTRDAGRYLAIRFDFDPMSDTEMSGFDMDVVSNGRR